MPFELWPRKVISSEDIWLCAFGVSYSTVTHHGFDTARQLHEKNMLWSNKTLVGLIIAEPGCMKIEISIYDDTD